MKTKTTIRKMHHAPLARDIAKLQRSIHSIQVRMTRLVTFADEIEQEGRTLRRENAELRGKLAVLTTTDSRLAAAETTSGGKPTQSTDQAELWPDLPNGEGIARIEMSYSPGDEA